MKKEFNINLAKIIDHNAFTGAIVYSLQRLGKSSYAMQAMYELYGNWDDVFANMFYKIDDLTGYLIDRVEHDDPILPAILWDDAGVHANKLLYFQDVGMADLIKRLFDVIGTATKGIILTTPVPGELLKSLRNYQFIKIQIMKGKGANDRIAKGYDNKLLPSGKRYNPTIFEDHYNVLLPNAVFNKYNPIRAGYFKEALFALNDLIKNKKLEACVKEQELDSLRQTMERYA